MRSITHEIAKLKSIYLFDTFWNLLAVELCLPSKRVICTVSALCRFYLISFHIPRRTQHLFCCVEASTVAANNEHNDNCHLALAMNAFHLANRRIFKFVRIKKKEERLNVVVWLELECSCCLLAIWQTAIIALLNKHLVDLLLELFSRLYFLAFCLL